MKSNEERLNSIFDKAAAKTAKKKMYIRTFSTAAVCIVCIIGAVAVAVNRQSVPTGELTVSVSYDKSRPDTTSSSDKLPEPSPTDTQTTSAAHTAPGIVDLPRQTTAVNMPSSVVATTAVPHTTEPPVPAVTKEPEPPTTKPVASEPQSTQPSATDPITETLPLPIITEAPSDQPPALRPPMHAPSKPNSGGNIQAEKTPTVLSMEDAEKYVRKFSAANGSVGELVGSLQGDTPNGGETHHILAAEDFYRKLTESENTVCSANVYTASGDASEIANILKDHSVSCVFSGTHYLVYLTERQLHELCDVTAQSDLYFLFMTV